jgi:hypothetical protein
MERDGPERYLERRPAGGNKHGPDRPRERSAASRRDEKWMNSMDMMKRFTIVLTLLAASSAPLDAQLFWDPPQAGRSVLVEVVKPRLVQLDDWFPQVTHTYLASAVFLQLRAPLTSGLALTSDIALSHVSGRANECLDATCMRFVHGTALGNPYIGTELASGSRVLTAGLGVRSRERCLVGLREAVDARLRQVAERGQIDTEGERSGV